MYLVSSFRVIAHELKDGLEDIGFIEMNGIFFNKTAAYDYAYKLYLHRKKADRFKFDRINEDDGGVITYYLSNEKLAKDFLLNEVDGFVINVREVDVDPAFDPEE